MNYQINEVKNFILKCYASAGQNPSIQDVDALIMLFCREVETNWKRHIRITNKGEETESWNLNEIFYFIELGLTKVFGEYFGINLITFKQFEHAYSKNEYIHYRRQYLIKNPLPPQKELSQYTDSGKDEVVIDSIINKLRNNTASEADYNVWFTFLEKKGAVNNRSWQKFIYNKEDDYEPAKERYMLELVKRKRFAESTYNLELLSIINKNLQNVDNNQPDIKEIEFWSKILFFEELAQDSNKINQLETFLKQK